MRIHRCADAVRVLAPAKVNLFLEVLRRREDGYHDLATLMLTYILLYELVRWEKIRSAFPTAGPEFHRTITSKHC